MDEQLTDRKKRILKAIIKTYMETGEPVGSRTISKDADLNVSSATIRNEMSDLTDMGSHRSATYIWQEESLSDKMAIGFMWMN